MNNFSKYFSVSRFHSLPIKKVQKVRFLWENDKGYYGNISTQKLSVSGIPVNLKNTTFNLLATYSDSGSGKSIGMKPIKLN